MNQSHQIIMGINLIISIFSMILSLLLWRINREKLYRYITLYWAGSVILSVIMVCSQLLNLEKTYEPIILYAGGTFLIFQVVLRILNELHSLNIRINRILTIEACFLILVFFLALLRVSPKVIAVLASLAYLPFLYWPLRIQFTKPFKQLGIIFSGFNLFLLLTIIHGMTFPYFRDASSEVIGVGYMIMTIFWLGQAILLPALIIETIRRKENVRLEKLVDKRTKALTRSNQELEQFAYVASHDLQEPLRMVSSYVKLLEKRNKDKLDSDSKEYVEFAVDGAVRMQQLINDLLTYSRVSTKANPFEATQCATVYEKAIKNLEISIKEHKAKVTHDDLPEIMADEVQLVQLFQNLIGNALKFCKDRIPEVHVSAKEDDGEWVFGVRDNGIGIAAEHRERIFQIFQRLHSREEYKGTGIGLAVCKKIVEKHGGKIWIDSEVGKGTTFWFTIRNRAENEK